MNQLAATAKETAGMPRSEAFLRAGEQYLLADDPAAAAGGFRRAMMDGGPVFVDPRVPLARALFQLGRHAEAQALISRLKTEGAEGSRGCATWSPSCLVERGDLRGRAGVGHRGRGAVPEPCGRAGRGVGRATGSLAADQVSDNESELRLLLSLRYRIRNDLGLPEDRYDQLLDEK